MRLQEILDGAADGLAWLDGSGRIEGCNERFAALAGRARESLAGLRPADALRGLPPLPSSGEAVEFSSGGRFLEVRPGAGGSVLTVRDATGDKERRDEAVDAARRDAEVLSYSVIHDLRAPLRAIGGFTDILLESAGGLTGEQQDLLRRARDASRSMTRLIEGVMTFLSVSRGEVFRQEVDLSAEAAAAAAAVRESAPGRRAEFVIAPGLKAEGAPGLVRELLDQLFRNAWKFTSAAPDARIEFGSAPDGERGAAYFVRDNGAGFDPLYAGKLFLPFQRLHSAPEYAGHGLGLAIARRIAELHGGRAWAEGEPGRGATFYFTLGPRGD